MPEQVLSAGVIIIRKEAPAPRLLLLRAYNYWDFPKGTVEPGEQPLDAAIREVREETGITDLRFPWGAEFRETPPYRRNKVARYYVGESDEKRVVLGINPLLGRPEHHAHTWATVAEARDLLSPRVQPILEWAVALTGIA